MSKFDEEYAKQDASHHEEEIIKGEKFFTDEMLKRDKHNRHYMVMLVSVLCALIVILIVIVSLIAGKLPTSSSDIYKEVKELRKSKVRMESLQAELIKQTKNNEMLSAIIAGDDRPIITVSDQGIIKSWNAGAERLIGVKASQAVGYGPAFFIPQAHRDNHKKSFEQAMRSNSDKVRLWSVECEIEVKGKKSPVRMEVWSYPGIGAIALIHEK